MSVRSFFDTNVLAYTDDATTPKKQRLAVRLFEEHHRNRNAVVSLQVLQEYFTITTRKLQLDPQEARRKVELFATADLVTPRLDDILAAIDLHRLHGFSYWDALIIRSAREAGCKVLFTEDLQHERMIAGVKIVNPFL